MATIESRSLELDQCGEPHSAGSGGLYSDSAADSDSEEHFAEHSTDNLA